MSKKSKSYGSHHDTVEDDEPEAGWTEDTAAETPPEDLVPSEHDAAPSEDNPWPNPDPEPMAAPPPAPPLVRLNAVIAQLQHTAAHNGPIPPPAITELQAIANELAKQDGGAPAIPAIDSIEPTTAPEGTLVLVVTGRNFSAASVICYGDVNQQTQVKSDLTQLTATFESGPPGTYDVNVHDPAGDANTVQFVVT